MSQIHCKTLEICLTGKEQNRKVCVCLDKDLLSGSIFLGANNRLTGAAGDYDGLRDLAVTS